MHEKGSDVAKLSLESTIGFAGKIPNGLQVHPDRQHLIFPLGCTVVIENLANKEQDFLSGHTDSVSCIVVSKSGKYVASGQETYMGFKAEVIVWDFETRSLYCRLLLHKVKVQDLAFSPNEKYIVSLGGQDDGSVVVWDLLTKEAICGSPAQVMSAGNTKCLTYSNLDDSIFVTGGESSLRVWELDVKNRKIRATDVTTGQVKRNINCMVMAPDDKYFYCGTTTGDVIMINVTTKLFQKIFPEKSRFSLGVTALELLKNGDFILGAGDGSLHLLKGDKLKSVKSAKLMGGVSSIALRGDGHQFFVGTIKSHVYRFSLTEFNAELISTSNDSSVTDVAFPYGCSELFATCSYETIRIWHPATSKELLRITVPSMACNSVCFMRDGRSIISAWDDGKIRSFFPESGSLMYTINDAHNKGVTAIATTSDCRRIVSGGGEGQLRVWDVTPNVQTLVESLKEHKAAITCIRIRSNNKECVTASNDGTCIIWNIERFSRSQIVFANTLFKCVCYHPDEGQIIASGTDRKIGYWEVYDGALIRQLDGSKSGAVNGIDVSEDGVFFVTGGDDRLVKLWLYNEGEVKQVGVGHSAPINKIRICPSTNHIISVSVDGGILRWKMPVKQH